MLQNTGLKCDLSWLSLLCDIKNSFLVAGSLIWEYNCKNVNIHDVPF
jgi:hypothetical protein